MDKIYKLKDVKKGQKLRFFFDYNFIPLLGIILAIVISFFIIKGVFFSPENDYGVILINTDDADYSLDKFQAEVSQRLESVIGDVNGDGEVKFRFSYSHIDEKSMQLDPEYYSAMVDKYSSEVDAAKALILIGDEYTFSKSYIGINKDGIAALNSELDIEGLSVDDTFVKIPFTSVDSLKDLKYADRLFLSIRSASYLDMEDNDVKANYDNNLKAFMKIIGK